MALVLGLVRDCIPQPMHDAVNRVQSGAECQVHGAHPSLPVSLYKNSGL
jgi:hypothetical protein